MNKYQEALNKIIKFSALYEDEYEGGSEKTQRNENIIQELVDKEIELQSRKDKLVVGSEWECLAENRGRNTVFKKGIETYIWEIEENFITFGYGTVNGYARDSAPIEQFLLCFKPR